ncbi:VOC family protein [Roseovarius aestuarii]|uniref:Glyoxalase-like domain protein n=1 Tax=Roseovarius aestuarii TaxID=475083 RepID=A0A1X7BQ61_9RHOB|nr:VOC family protein [Roseovarius aestuarii]SMC11796.1 Glyoxalase-like domain protein [Roseovarius aestuarii]
MLGDWRVTPHINVQDISRATKFYRDNLGLKEVGPSKHGTILECADGSRVGLVEFPDDPDAQHEHTVLGFDVDNVQMEVQKLKDAGIEFIEYSLDDGVEVSGQSIETKGGIAKIRGSLVAWFRDSEGNILSIDSK